jgi:hypothetical protein
MSNLQPIFMSGPRMKLILDGVTVAHCIGFNLNVRKTVRPVHTLGEFGPLSVQTMLFDGVEGSFQIQLLNPFIADKATAAESIASQRPDRSTGFGTTPNNTHVATADPLAVNNSVKNVSDNLKYMFDAAKILLTSTFVLEVWQSYPNPDSPGEIIDIKQLVVDKVRLSGIGTNISLSQLVSQNISFTGAYCKVLSPDLTGESIKKIIESDTILDASI